VKTTILLVLLALIVGLLFYQFVYKDWQYRRSALAQRDELLKRLYPVKKRMAEIKTDVQSCYDDILKDTFRGEREKFCHKITEENSKLSIEAQAVSMVFGELDRAVRNRFNGIPPAWWFEELPTTN
jgi:hypothetical protein